MFIFKWQLQDAKARFSELIDDTLEKGPQVVTRRGIDTAVILSIDEWRKLKDKRRLTWKDVLLGEGPRFEIPLPRRGQISQASGVRLILYLIDTNVVSELRKLKPHGAAFAWLKSLQLGQGFFSAVTFGEIQNGVELMRRQDPVKANEIEAWAALLDRTAQILPMDAACFRE